MVTSTDGETDVQKTLRGIVYQVTGSTLYYHQRMGSRLVQTKETGFATPEAAMARADEIAVTNYNPYEVTA